MSDQAVALLQALKSAMARRDRAAVNAACSSLIAADVPLGSQWQAIAAALQHNGEHGAALRGDATQIPGLREIPMPAITLVPVMVKVIGPDAKRNGDAAAVSEPTSYLAISHIVSEMLAKPPFGASGFDPGSYVEGLPATEFVSEGETAMVVRRGNAYLLKLERDPWKELE